MLESSTSSTFVALSFSVGFLLSAAGARGASCPPLEPTLESFKAFIEAGCFDDWPHDKTVRLSGARGKDDTPFTVHDRFQVYYSPTMARWMMEFRPDPTPVPPPPMPAPPDGAAMIAAVYPVGGEAPGGSPQSWIFMLRDSVASYDGWYWGRLVPSPPGSEARFGLGRCLACHSSADSYLTFADLANIETSPGPPQGPYTPPPTPGQPLSPVRAPADNALSRPLGDAAAEKFVHYYRGVSGLDLPQDLTAGDVVPMPPEDTDHAFLLGDRSGLEGSKTGEQFVTSDECQGCHDGTVLLSNAQPNMTFEAQGRVFEAQATPGDQAHLVDFSQYGEWSVSLMALAARDPVFQAQAETERDLKPGVDPNAIDNVCYSCHGPMGQRQYHLDLITGNEDPPFFSHYMVFSTPRTSEFYRKNHDRFPTFRNPLAAPRFSEFGSLARDGVSCAMCHHLGPYDGTVVPTDNPSQVDWQVFYGPLDEAIPARENPPGPPYHFTSNFQFDTTTLYGPPAPDATSAVSGTYSHGQALGMNLVRQEYFTKSEACGSCHVVIVPQIPATYHGNPLTDPRVGLAYEQSTYFEFLVSEYAAFGLPCQGCHMPDLLTSADESLEIANIESDLYPKVAYRAPDPDIRLQNGDGLQAKHYARHRLLGINLFVHEMFQQFHELLGVDPVDPDAPDHTVLDLLNAKQSIIEHAIGDPPTVSVEICGFSEKSDPTTRTLTTDVLVINNAGHKFPTGAGFRRGWLEFEVLDENDRPVWTSGAFNEYGVLVDPRTGEPLESEFTRDPDKIQKHRETITEETQVQVYEIRDVDCRVPSEAEPGAANFLCDCDASAPLLNNCPERGTRPPLLTTSTLTLFHTVKDNRILPRGWGLNLSLTGSALVNGLRSDTLLNITGPEGDAKDDRYYMKPPGVGFAGADHVTFKVEIPADVAVDKVRATVHYQTIPPYFLVDRFRDGMSPPDSAYEGGEKRFAPATERLLYMTSHLDTRVRTPRALVAEAMRKGDALPSFVSRDWTMTLDRATHKVSDGNRDLCTTFDRMLMQRSQLLRTIPGAPGAYATAKQ